MSIFDYKAVLADKTDDIVARLADFTVAQIEALHEAERAGKDRVTLLRALVAEREARLGGGKAGPLSEDSVARLTGIAYVVAGGDPAALVGEGDTFDNALAGVATVLAGDVDMSLPFDRAVALVAPLFAEIEQLQTQPVSRPVLVADDDAKPSRAHPDRQVSDFAALALLSAGDTVEKRWPVRPGQFRVERDRAIYGDAVELTGTDARMAISAVALLDDADRVVSRVQLVAPLQGGGGRSARIGAGGLAFPLS